MSKEKKTVGNYDYKKDALRSVMEGEWSEAAFSREVERHYRWNFIVNALDGAFFWLGFNFIATSTVIPIYVARLTSSRLLIGLASAIAASGWFIPQLFLANHAERLARKKPFVVLGGFLLERFPLLPLAFATYFFAGSRPAVALGLFFVFYTWHRLGSGALAPAWEDMLAKVIPVQRRGRFFGIANFLGAGMGILGARATTLILARYAFPDNFAYCMALAFIALMISWTFLALTREPARPPAKERLSQLQYWRQLPGLLRRDRNFARYLASRALSGLGSMATGLTAVYAVQRWGLPDQQAGIYTTILLVSQTGCNLLFGYLGDRRGHKLSLELGLAAWASAMILAFMAPVPSWFYLVFLAAGAASAAELVAGLMILLEFGGADNRPTYVGLGNTTAGLFYGLSPAIGGAIAAMAGFRLVFAVSLAATLAAWALLHFSVREPRSKAKSP